MTHTVTDRGEFRSAAGRFIVSDLNAHATFSIRSTVAPPATPRRRQREQREDDGTGVQAERLQHRRQVGLFGVVDEDVLGAEAYVSLRDGEQQQEARATPRRPTESSSPGKTPTMKPGNRL